MSGDSSAATLNVMEIQQQSQIYCRIIIEEKTPDCQKIDIDFIFSEFRIVVSLPTIQQVLNFTKKLSLGPETPVNDLATEEESFRDLSVASESFLVPTEQPPMLRRASVYINGPVRKDSKASMDRANSWVPFKVRRKQLKIKFNGRFKNLSLWVPLDVSVTV